MPLLAQMESIVVDECNSMLTRAALVNFHIILYDRLSGLSSHDAAGPHPGLLATLYYGVCLGEEVLA